jgi:deoxyribodipyrimidine photolyase-related protein
MIRKLRLIIGDQLNPQHSWFDTVDDAVTYVMMEVRSETDYALHHIQKIVGFFAAMRNFAEELQAHGHQVVYLNLNDANNLGSFEVNLEAMLQRGGYTHFEYQLPDEYRVDQLLKAFVTRLKIEVQVFDTEHFYTTREELGLFFSGKKTLVMESFYRSMRKKHQVLTDGDQPLNGQWNFDAENRKKLPKGHIAIPPLLFNTDVSEILDEIHQTDIKFIGSIEPGSFIWPISRSQSLELLEFFVTWCLPCFGSYQDAMSPGQWSLYHSRLSFSLNTKMISPVEVVDRAIRAWRENPDQIAYHQLEGFVRQIIGWREYMRGVYWLKMPGYASLNFFEHQAKLPSWFWTGKTRMNCLKDAIHQSLQTAYAHHIQRLMITGNFALLAGVDPDQLDGWYLGIYIDALDWVEITNTRGMSQFADGGIVGTKPYVSSAAYIDKMSHYCGSCHYNKALKVGEKACPFNSLYWNFYDRHAPKLAKNPRIGMAYTVWGKMKPEDKAAILQQAEYYLKHIDEL